MDIHDFEGGFYTEGLKSVRKPCHAQTLFQAACGADEMITGKTEFYLSMYKFPTEFIERLQREESTAGYQGACWSRWLWFDIDREGDLSAALDDAAALAEFLVWGRLDDEDLPCTPEKKRKKNMDAVFVSHGQCLSLWFSGAKGFHVGVPITVFGDAAVPSEAFASQCKAVAMEIARLAGVTIDKAVYDRVRLFRCPNTRHGKTGLYKIPLSYNEIRQWDVSEILERAKCPRRLVLLSQQGLGVGDSGVGEEDDADAVKLRADAAEMKAAMELWRGVCDDVAGREKRKDTDEQTGSKSTRFHQTQTLPESGESVPRLRRATLEFIRHGIERGEREVALFKAAADCTRCEWPEGAVFSVLMDVARDMGLSGYETEKQIVDGIAAGMKGVE